MTLTEAAIFIKSGYKYVLAALVGIVALWMLVGFLISSFQKIHPAIETPTLGFGKIPRPTLPVNTTAKLAFVLDTVDGRLPLLPTVLPVYQFVFPTPNLLDQDRAKNLAADFGFTSDPKSPDNQNFTYTDPKNPSQQITINSTNKNFELLTTNYSDPVINKTPPSDALDDIVSGARSILKAHSLLPVDLAKSTAKVSYKKISGGTLLPANSISEANFARVDIFRDGVAGYPIVEPKTDEALVNLLLSGGRQERTTIAGLGYTYWQFLIDGAGTYPLLPTQAALDQLKAGQGSLISPLTATFSEVRIKDIKVAYFQAKNYQPYLQPIYLFSGVANPQSGPEVPVTIYLPAVDPAQFSQ